VYEGKPEDEAIDTYALRAGGRGNPGLAAQKSTGRSPRATRTSSPAARRAYERQAELVASLQKGASPVSMLILKMSMSLDGFVADANGDKAFIFSSMSEDAATAPKQYSSAGTASEPLAPSTTWSAGPDASY
jgi:hypothetical protein